ncbi:MAG: hypothetical protein JXR83_16540 [Deltaproteobacteria bacterium]|nr:hypothetical protein [Deltaproteobacteria bacterium]
MSDQDDDPIGLPVDEQGAAEDEQQQEIGDRSGGELREPQRDAGSALRSERLTEAREALLVGIAERALDICEAEMRPGESDRDWLLLRAEALISCQRAIDALEDLIAVLRVDPKQPEALFRVGQIFLQADEPAHAERYLRYAVQFGGPRKSYGELLKQAHQRALTETSRLQGPTASALPSAEEEVGAEADDKERLRAALGAALAFERQVGLFDSRLTAAISNTKKMIPRVVDIGRHSGLPKVAIWVGAVLVGLVLLAGLAVVGVKVYRWRQAAAALVGSIDRGVTIGGPAARAAALAKARELLQGDPSNQELGLRAAWLLAARHLYDTPDGALLKEAQALLDRHADPGLPRAVLASALLAVASGQAPGTLVTNKPMTEPQYESMRQEVLAADARNRGNAAEALRMAQEALKARPGAIDILLEAGWSALDNHQLKTAEELLQKLAKADRPSVALLDAHIKRARAKNVKEVSSALAPAVAPEATDRVRFRALALAISLRAEVSDPGSGPPPFGDIEEAIGKNPVRAQAAAEELLEQGWPDLAERALANGGIKKTPTVALALEVASGNLARAKELIAQVGVTAAPLLRTLAASAAEAGDIALSDACLARLELLLASPCAMAATRGRVAVARGLATAPSDLTLLKDCVRAGPTLLWRVASAIAGKEKPTKESLRTRLLHARRVGLSGLEMLGEHDLWREEPVRADEAGRILLRRRNQSRAAISLRMRAAMQTGDYGKAWQIYRQATEDQRRDPELIGVAAWAQIGRGDKRAALELINDAQVPVGNRGQGRLLAARSLAGLTERNATATVATLLRADPSPYVLEALAYAYWTQDKYSAAAAALDRAGGAPERLLERDLLRARVAFALADRSRYGKILTAVEKKAQRMANGPVQTEARLRRVAVVSSNQTRREVLKEINEMLSDWKRRDPRAPRIQELYKLMWRVQPKPLDFPK